MRNGINVRNNMDDDIEKLPDEAPLERVPRQELEIIFLFAEHFKSLGFTKIKKIQQKFPDCIAYRKTSSGRKEVVIGSKLQSINFHNHKHDVKKCDCIVCWEDNWLDKPKNSKLLNFENNSDLNHEYGLWLWEMIIKRSYLKWTENGNGQFRQKVMPGDLILFLL